MSTAAYVGLGVALVLILAAAGWFARGTLRNLRGPS